MSRTRYIPSKVDPSKRVMIDIDAFTEYYELWAWIYRSETGMYPTVDQALEVHKRYLERKKTR